MRTGRQRTELPALAPGASDRYTTRAAMTGKGGIGRRATAAHVARSTTYAGVSQRLCPIAVVGVVVVFVVVVGVVVDVLVVLLLLLLLHGECKL